MWNPFRSKKREEINMLWGINEIGQEASVVEEKAAEIDEIAEEQAEIQEPAEETVVFEPVEDNVTRWFKKAIRFILLAAVVLTPIFFLTTTFPGDILTINKQLLIYLAAFLGLVCWLIIIIRQGGIVFKRSGLEIGILAMLVAWLFATIFSTQMYQSFISPLGFITWGAFAILSLLFVNFFEKKDLARITDYFLLGGFLALFFGILNLFGVPMFGWVSALAPAGMAISSQFNTIGTLDTMGAFSVLALILTIAKYLISNLKFREETLFDPAIAEEKPESKLKKWFWGIISIGLIAFSVVTILIINWWVLYTVLAVGVLAIALTPGIIEKIFKRKVKISATNIIGPLIILVLSLLMIFGGKYVDINYPGKSSVTPEVWLTQGTSYSILKSALNQRPVFGFGPDNYYIAYDNFRPVIINASSFWNTEFFTGGSEFLDLATNGGILAVIGFLVLLYFASWGAIRIVKRNSDFSGGIHLWTMVPVFLSAVILFALYSFNFVLYFVFWLIISLIALSVNQRSKEIKVPINDASLTATLTSLGFVVIFALALVGGYLLIENYSGQLNYNESARLDLKTSGNIDKAIILLNQAEGKGNGDLSYLNKLSQLYADKISTELANKTDKPADITARLQVLTKSAVDTANLMTTKYPNDPNSWLDAGDVFQNLDQILSGADDYAIKSYTEYTKRAPSNVTGYLKIGTVALNQAIQNETALANAKAKNQTVTNEKAVTDLITSDLNNSEIVYKQVITLKPDEANAYYYLSQVYQLENQLPEAIKQLEILVANGQQNNAELQFELGLLYYRNNQKGQAYSAMTAAVNIFSDYSNARWYLALMLEEQGKIPDAIAQLQKILSLDVNKDNQTVIDKIASLEAGQREIPPAKVTSKAPLE
jgi:hypothetical protein